MSEIPTNLTQAEFAKYVEPYLSKARRGYVCSIPFLPPSRSVNLFLIAIDPKGCPVLNEPLVINCHMNDI